MKKTLLLLLSVMCFLVFTGFDYNADKQYIYDEGNLLDDTEEADLRKMCEEASDNTKIEFDIVTTDDANGYSSQEYAEKFVIDNELGYEDDKDEKSCVLFLVDLDNGQTYIATSGFAIYCIEDSDIEHILDDIYEYIHDDYYQGCETFVESTENVINSNKNEYASQYEEKWETYDGSYKEFYNEYLNNDKSIFDNLNNPLISLVIAVIIGAISVAVMMSNNKAKMTANGDTYMNRNDVKIHVNSDNYINTTTTKIRIHDDSSSGGEGHGGSFHSGGGGHSFGGGGRSL